MFYLYLTGGIVAYLVMGFVVICLMESSDEMELAVNENPLGLISAMIFFTLIWPLPGFFLGMIKLIENYSIGWGKFKKRLNSIEISFKQEPE